MKKLGIFCSLEAILHQGSSGEAMPAFAGVEGHPMRIRIRTEIFFVFAVILLLVVDWQLWAADQAGEPDKFFHDFIGLTDDQIRAIRAGKAVAKILESPTPDEVFVFGSIYIDSSPERYLALASDIDALRRLPAYLAIQKFSDPPQLADLAGFTLDDEDIKELQQCKPGHCQVQLPTEAIEKFQESVNWSAPDRADQVNRLAQQLALQALQAYQQGGNAALATYRDKSHPAAVADTFASLLRQMKAVPMYLPELDRYLLEYPGAKADEIRSEFYWEKVNFGLKRRYALSKPSSIKAHPRRNRRTRWR
jgi:hypothetical protein